MAIPELNLLSASLPHPFFFGQEGMKVGGFAAEELVGIMDDMLCCLALWFRGRN